MQLPRDDGAFAGDGLLGPGLPGAFGELELCAKCVSLDRTAMHGAADPDGEADERPVDGHVRRAELGDAQVVQRAGDDQRQQPWPRMARPGRETEHDRQSRESCAQGAGL